MKKVLFFALLMTGSLLSHAQFGEEPTDTSWKKIYRSSETRINDLVHTKLDVRFDYEKAYLYGKEWVTLKPTFYSTDSVLLDAKGMEIKEFSLIKGTVKTPLKYTYDGLQINAKLDRSYKNNEKYTLYIDYVSKPN